MEVRQNTFTRFTKWAKEHNIRKKSDITEEAIQLYQLYLNDDPKQYSVATIHTYFTSFLDYVSLPESISKLIEEGYTDKRNQLDDYIDFAPHHNLITKQNNIIQATDLGLAWVWWAYAPVEGGDWI